MMHGKRVGMSAKVTLTDRWVRSAGVLPQSGQVETFDDRAPRFGVRITAKGSRTYFATYRLDGQPRRFTIGDATAIKADDARQEALRIHGLVKQGIDPNSERRRLEAAETAARRATAPITVADVVDQYFKKRVLPDGLRSATELRRLFDLHVIPTWGKRPAREIVRADVLKLLDSMRANGLPTQANRVLAALKTLFKWAIVRDHIVADPSVGVEKPTPEKARDRVLTDDELRLIWQAADVLGTVYGGFIRTLILTGQRRTETAKMKRSDIDVKNWLIPAETAKNGKAHNVPLSPLAITILDTLPECGPSAPMFTTDEGETSISEFVRTKKKLDDEVLRLAREEAAARGDDPKKVKAIHRWTLHDLRRTAASGMARLKIAPHVIEKVLNHSPREISGVAAVYNRHGYDTEKRNALETWANHVAMLVGAETAENVVPFKAVANA